MRRKLSQDSQARIILGGKMEGYAGRYPGIVEEAFEAVKLELPLYIVGGFGGAARYVYYAIVNPDAQISFRKAWEQRCQQSDIRETHTEYNHLAQVLNLDFRVDYEAMIRCFRSIGPTGLSAKNKLSPLENEALASSQDIHEILALLVKGLSRLVAL